MMLRQLSFIFLLSCAAFLQAEEQPAFAVDSQNALYLTPAGKYTKDDIAANQALTPAEKFKALKVSHNPHPKTGDIICPITKTKANPQCAWIIGGKSYQFCCPSCIDEFITMAKEHPELIKDPEEYIVK